MAKVSVSILMGSDSDYSVMKQAVDMLKQFEVPYDVRVLSAHRSPNELAEYVRQGPSSFLIYKEAIKAFFPISFR